MTRTSLPSTQEQLKRLNDAYRRQLAERSGVIGRIAQALSAGSWSHGHTRELHQLAHKLAGSAGSFGLPAISERARAVQDVLATLPGGDLEPGPRELETLAARVEALRRAVDDALHPARTPADPTTAHDPRPTAGHGKRLCLVEDDTRLARLISARLGHAGYDVRIFESVAGFLAECGAKTNDDACPAAVVLDIILPEGPDAGIETIAELKHLCRDRMPVVVISMRDDAETRLKALRLGASRYLAKPLDMDRLVRVLDDVTLRMPVEPYRVLLVDDDRDRLARHGSLLAAAGMQVRTVTEPLTALVAAGEFRPDVLVLAMTMSACSGFELAAILRETDLHAQVPILFLSDERDGAAQLHAHDATGDGFLARPVNPAQLVAAVTARARHARHLNRVSEDLRFTLRESSLRQYALDQHAIVSIADASGKIVYANSKFTEISGYSLAELLGQNHRLLKSGVHSDAFYEEMWATISGGGVWKGEICNRRKDGGYYWVESTIVPFLDANGLPYQYISVRTDVTNLMNVERELAEREERLRRSQIYANIGTWDWNVQTGALFWSERIGPLFGHPQGSLDTTYENFLNAVHPDDRQKVVDAVNACVERGVSYNIEHRCVWPDGTVHWLLESGDVTRDELGKPLHMLGVVQDITRRKEAELALQTSEQRLREAQRTAQLGHWLLDVASGDFEWSEEVYRIYGRDPAVFRPTLARYYAELVHPDDVAAVQREEQAAYATGRRHGIDHRIRWPDGTTRWVHVEGIAEFGEDGRPVRLGGVVQDITQRKEAEQQLIAARDEAERASRAKSDFLSSMSHELRTPMNAILGFAQLLEADAALTRDQHDNVAEILGAGHHLLELINEVLDLSRVESGRIDLSIEPVECQSLIAECLGIIRPVADACRVGLSGADGGDFAVRADRVRLKQALLNLLSNAVKYNRPGGEVRLTAQPVDGDRLQLRVADTGPGIPEGRVTELFQPFNRLGAELSGVEGTGIGLVITRRIVEMMGGSIGVESRVGEGSAFWIELPLDTRPDRLLTAAGRVAAGTATTGATCSVLYIEDNPANLKLVSQLLARRPNVRMLSAHTPMLGLDLADANRPDLVLLDINMPDLNGYDVLAKLRAHAWARDLPVIAITANALPRDIERGRAAGFSEYLTKPLDLDRFLAAIDRFLPGARGGAGSP